MTERNASLKDRFLVFIVEPMSLFWILIAGVLIAGVVITLRTGSIAWEAFFAAAMLSLLVTFTARLRDVHAWPWSGRRNRDEPESR